MGAEVAGEEPPATTDAEVRLFGAGLASPTLDWVQRVAEVLDVAPLELLVSPSPSEPVLRIQDSVTAPVEYEAGSPSKAHAKRRASAKAKVAKKT